MIQVRVENDFANWRCAARKLLQADVAPGQILWTNAEQSGLFDDFVEFSGEEKRFRVPVDFLNLAETVACHESESKWALLYRILFRLLHENRNLLEIESDADVREALLMQKSVRRDEHKFHAFVRFRRIEIGATEIFVAWHEPQHFTVERAAPFFVRRFGAMRFSILTAKGCAHWDLENLTFTAPVSSDLAPQADETEAFWLAYYSSIFNPFRLKVKAMKAEMPVRHWKTLPEARLIHGLVRAAEERQKQKPGKR